MKSRSFLQLSAAALVSLVPALHMSPAAAVEGYVTQGGNNAEPVRSHYGECVHDREWRSGMRFADCEPAPAVPVAAPAPQPAAEPVAEAPAPAPAPQPIPQNVPFRLAADAFFDFDKSTLKPEALVALDDLAQRLAVTNYDTITVVGHADRIGTPKYNQTLSERRAGAIRDYLVADGIDAGKLLASGVGASEPTAQCGHLRGARLVACLQPDRYAEMTVSGTVVQVSTAPAN
jgi:outer membrane protein OmpA-like peptidoglycan-associated protein